MERKANAFGSPLWNAVALLILLIAFGFLAYHLRAALYPIVFGGLIAIAVFPWVRSMQGKRRRRLLAASLLFILAALLGALLLGFVAAQLSNLFAELFAVSPSGEKTGAAYKAVTHLEAWIAQMDARFQLGEKGRAWLEDLPAKIEASWQSIAKTAGSAMAIAVGIAGSILDLLSLLFLTPLFAFLLVLEYEKIREGILRIARPTNRERAAKLATQIESVLGGFLRGRVLTGGIRAVAQTALLLAIGAPYAILCGLLFWVLCFVPFVGPVIAFAPTLILLAISGSWGVLAAAIGILLLGELAENYLLIPRFVGSRLGLTTLELLAAVLLGGAALGFLGLLFAVPAAAIGKLLLADWIERREAS